MTEQVLGFLGLMRRAGALAVGAEDAFDAARENKARVLLMAGDVAKNTVSAMHNAAAQKEAGIPLVKLDCTKRELGAALGVKECAALAVWLHSRAGLLARAENGAFAMLPRDVLDNLGPAFLELEG